MRLRPSIVALVALGLVILGAPVFWFARRGSEGQLDESSASLRDEQATRDPTSAQDGGAALLAPSTARTEPSPEMASGERFPVPTEVPGDAYAVHIIDCEGAPVADYKPALFLRRWGSRHETTEYRVGLFPPQGPPLGPRVSVPREAVRDQLKIAAEEARTTDGLSTRLTLGLDSHCLEMERHVFADADAEPRREPIVLRIGPAGRVRVEVRDAAGAILEQEIEIDLRLAPASWGIDAERSFASLPVTSIRAARGEHVFRHVRIGEIVEVDARDPRGALREAQARCPGPIGKDHEVVVSLQLGLVAPRLAGRLLDEKQEPLRGIAFRLASRNRVGSVGDGGTTDGEGRFDIPWSAKRRTQGTIDSLEFRIDAGVPRPLRAQLVPPVMPEAGIVDLGDVMLRPDDVPGPIASVRIVDEEGRGLAASFTVWEVWPPLAEGPWELSRNLTSLGGWTGADGTAVIRSADRFRALRFVARAEGFLRSEPVILEAPARDVLLLLRRGADLAGRVLLDTGFDPLALRASYDGGMAGRRVEDVLDASGAFLLKGLAPGRGAVEVHVDRYRVARIEDISIAGAELHRDPRLEPIDLRGALRRWKLRVLEEQDRPCASKRIVAGSSEPGTDSLFATTDLEGRAELVVPAAIDALRLGIHDRAIVECRFREEEQVLRLAPGLRARFLLDRALDLPEGFVVLVGFQVPLASALPPAARSLAPGAELALSASEPQERIFPMPGPYSIRWLVRSNLSEQWEHFDDQPIEIPAGASAEVIRLRPDEAKLRRAIELVENGRATGGR